MNTASTNNYYVGKAKILVVNKEKRILLLFKKKWVSWQVDIWVFNMLATF